ncbi:2,4-dichlorophenol 6-monooxygenase, partial [bacterium]
MEHESTAVLVVGGSLVGLSAAVFLASRGVATIVVERHAGSSVHPRAVGFTPRTMELFRGVGLGEEIPQTPADFRLRRARVESLAGRWLDESPWTPGDGRASSSVELSPCTGAAIAQDRLEPILRTRAATLGADIRPSTELRAFTQDAAGVHAHVSTRDGEAYEIRAPYMIAADGGKSAIRQALGLGLRGRGPMRTLRSVLFRAPLEEYLARGIVQFEVERDDFKGFLTTYGDGRWVLMMGDDEERDECQLRRAVQG